MPFSICSTVTILANDAGSVNTEMLLVFLVPNVIVLSVIPCWATYNLDTEGSKCGELLKDCSGGDFAERARTNHETSIIYRKFCP